MAEKDMFVMRRFSASVGNGLHQPAILGKNCISQCGNRQNVVPEHSEGDIFILA